MDKNRRRLSDVAQERSRVLDLVCHAPPRSARELRRQEHHSARRPLSAISSSQVQEADPLGGYTPEADDALKCAQDARKRYSTPRKFISFLWLFAAHTDNPLFASFHPSSVLRRVCCHSLYSLATVASDAYTSLFFAFQEQILCGKMLSVLSTRWIKC